MQGTWGWGGADKPHTPTAECWQGQWESHGRGESTGWDSGNWDQLNIEENSHSEEFANVMRWDDSGALEAFEMAKKLNEGYSGGWTSSLSLPSPDLYIQPIDWDSHEDLKLPEPGETSPHGEKTGQRKRGRRGGGGFRRQFDRQDFSIPSSWNQRSKPVTQPVCYSEEQAQPERDHALYQSSSNAPRLDGPLDSSQRDELPSQWQSPFQDHSKRNWPARWSSQPHQRQGFAGSNWQDHGKGNWDEQQNWQAHQSHHRWQQTNVSSEQAGGWGGAQHQSSHGLLSDHRYQATPTAHRAEWMHQGGANERGFQHQSMGQISRGSKQHSGPSYAPDRTRRWRQHPQPTHPWQ